MLDMIYIFYILQLTHIEHNTHIYIFIEIKFILITLTVVIYLNIKFQLFYMQYEFSAV